MAANFAVISERIAAACRLAGRSPAEITIVGASKGVPQATIREAYNLGIRHFGENYLQEALAKQPKLPEAINWHFIGRIQSNKAVRIAKAFDWVETLDTLERARLVSHGAEQSGRLVDVLIEVNIAEEPQKAGVLPQHLDKLVEKVYYLPGVRFRGLMTMGPNLNAGAMRPYFQRMRRLMEGLALEGVDCLSMGMSGDFEVAIQEGATHVRIGTALFGRRAI